MLPTFIISFREFLEAFLIIGVFLGISRKLKLKKEIEILLAAVSGIVVSILLSVVSFSVGSKASAILNEENAEILEAYLMIFSGIFIAYIVLSLHRFFALNRSKDVIGSHKKLQAGIFDLSLFLTIMFLVIREGFEIALFTATTSLFSTFMGNLSGLLLGFMSSFTNGILTYFTFLKFSINKIYKLTEHFIVLIGAAFVKNGLVELIEIYLKVNLKNILPITLNFLPEKSTFFGHMLNSFFGIEKNFSLPMLLFLIGYIFFVYFIFFKKSIKKV